MTIDYSQFSGDEFTGQATSRPHCQVINDAGDQGLFIRDEIIDRVEFDSKGFPPYTFKTKKGEKIQGILIQSPRILIIHVGDLICTLEDGTKTHWRAEYKENRKIAKKTKYLLFFLDAKNNFLHSEPIQLNAGGVFSSSFSKSYRAFKEAFQKAWTELSKDRKPKNQGFFCHAVFAFNTTHELYGTGNDVNQCCVVKDFVLPTTKNIEDGTLFLGGDNAKRAIIRQAFVDNEGYGTLAQELALRQDTQPLATPAPSSDGAGDPAGGDNFF